VVNGQLGNQVGWAGDVNRDGYDDVLVASPFTNQAGPQSGIVQVLSVMAAVPYGQGAGAGNTLSLEWVPGRNAASFRGLLVTSGALPDSHGVLLASLSPALDVIGSVALLVDVTLGHAVALPLTFDTEGRAAFEVTLHLPVHACVGHYLQVAENRLGVLALSNGLLLLPSL
jgi:hypothetical protein